MRLGRFLLNRGCFIFRCNTVGETSWSRCCQTCKYAQTTAVDLGSRTGVPYLNPFRCRRTRTTGRECAPPVGKAHLLLNCLCQTLANDSGRQKSRPGGLSYGDIARIETGRSLLLRGLGIRQPPRGDNYRNGVMNPASINRRYAICG